MIDEKIINYKGVDYIVSSDGHVYSTKNVGYAKYHKEIKQRYTKDGYLQITVGNGKNRTQCRVHRLVAMAFVPNSNNLPEVNHKNFIRDDNRAENLEWSTYEDNIQYSANAGNYVHYGENNSNYGKHTLSDKYKNDPELSKEVQSRPGAQNGRAKRIILFDVIESKELIFDYIKAASEYLIKNGFTKANKVDSVLNRLSACAKSGKSIKIDFMLSLLIKNFNKYVNTVSSSFARRCNDYSERKYIYGETPYLEVPAPTLGEEIV